MNKICATILEVSKRDDRDEILELEPLIEQELQKDPHNTELLVRLAMLVQDMPFADKIKSVDVLGKVLDYDSHNGIAMILRAYLSYWYSRNIKKSWCDDLSSVTTGDTEVDSMMRFTASLYYETEDVSGGSEYEKLLLESIDLCQDHVNNYKALAKLYLKQGKYSEAEKFAKTALKNVVKIYTGISGYPNPDITDYNKFFSEFVKGTHLTDTSIWRIQKIGIEACARNKLQRDPLQINALLDLAVAELFNHSISSEKKFVSINKVLSQDKDNPTALILLAYQAYIDKNFDESLVQKLTTFKTVAPEINSMFLFSASRLYVNNDGEKCEELLLQSIKEYPWLVHNYLDLAQLYTKQHKLVEAKDIKQKAFNNVARIFSIDEEFRNIENVEKLINQAIKGIWLSEQAYKSLYEELSTPNQ